VDPEAASRSSTSQSKPEPAASSPLQAERKAAGARSRRDRSAGGVAYRRDAETGQLYIALIATRGGARWQLPKGAQEADESLIETAKREVWEEVGLKTVEEGFLREIDYWYWDTYRKSPPERVHKSVTFYLLRTVGGVLSDASFEVDAVGWFTPQEALARLTFSGELQVLRDALARLGVDAA
jgi:8-oxo-dGTP pyrophosphatase MutT (NUDIX family)